MAGKREGKERGETAKREPALHSIRTIPPKLCVGYTRTRRRIIYCPCESHGIAALFAAGRNICRRARWFLARPAPLHLGLLIVLELLVRRIIELRLLPWVMKVDGPWGPRRSHPDHASARRLMKTEPSYEMPYERSLSGEDALPPVLFHRCFVSSRTATVRSYSFFPAIFRLPLSRSAAALRPRYALID